jgi:zinc D-Ala-D-Ala carboxypeptidase
MDLSKHFTLAEMTFSRTAAAERIDNTPGDAERANLEALCRSVLDPLRDAAGAAITVTSGYRGPVLNTRIKGELRSQHLEGKAADIQPTTMTVLELFKTVVRLALPFDQVIYEAKSATSKWVHVSHNGATNRADIRVARFLPTGKVERYEKVTAQQALEMQEAVSRSAQRIQPLEYDEMNDEPGDDEEPKATAKKTLVKTAPAKKAPAKKSQPKKTVAKKAAPKKAAPKKVAPKKVAPKKAAPKKVTAKKTAVKKIATKKPPAKKAASRKSAKPAVGKKR